MFGSCAGKAEEGSDEEDNPRRPKRYTGQRRELVVKEAARVSKNILVAGIREIEEKLSDDEREYEARAAERQEERRQRAEQLEEAAIQNAVSGASGQLSGSLFDKVGTLSKLRESAKSALKLELGGIATSGNTLANGGSLSSATDEQKMPLPEAATVTVAVTHPCYVSMLRTKLHRRMDIPLTDIRIVHRHKTLKDEDLVPDDTVDNGEQNKVGEVLTGDGLDLSYLWVVDASILGPRSRPSTPNAGGSSSAAVMKQNTSTTIDVQGEHQSSDDKRTGDGGDEGTEEMQGGGGSLVRSLEPEPEGENSPPGGARDVSVDDKAKKRAQPKKKARDRGSGGSDGEQQQDKPQQQQKKIRKGRLVPGSLLMTTLSASDLPNTEKGVFSKQDPYLVVKWGGQEVRTSAKRDSGKDCSWPKEELALIVRTKKQLQESVELEVWNDNAGDKKPSPDVLIAKGSLPVKHLAIPPPTDPPASKTDGTGSAKGDDGRDNNTDDERGREGVVLVVDLVHGDGKRRKRKHTAAGIVTLTLEYIPPRRKKSKAEKEEDKAAAAAAAAAAKGTGEKGDQTATDTDDDLSSIAGLSTLSIMAKRNHLSVQELGAAMSQALEGFDIREELGKIGCLRYAQGIINEGFGQRGAFADIQEEHLVGHPIYVPRGARKRLLALAELVRLQMKAETREVTTAMEEIIKNGDGAFDGRYTVDGVAFFDTLMGMKSSLEEDRIKAELAIVKDESITKEQAIPLGPKPPKPRSAAKEKVIRAIEATAEADERGVHWTPPVGSDKDGHGERKKNRRCDGRGDVEPCCEKHAFQLERSSMHMMEERVRDTLSKVDVWLDHADRFKNGAIPREAVATVTRNALLLNGLPSPRESDARISLQHAFIDSQELQFDRSKLGVELEHLIRKELFHL